MIKSNKSLIASLSTTFLFYKVWTWLIMLHLSDMINIEYKALSIVSGPLWNKKLMINELWSMMLLKTNKCIINTGGHYFVSPPENQREKSMAHFILIVGSIVSHVCFSRLHGVYKQENYTGCLFLQNLIAWWRSEISFEFKPFFVLFYLVSDFKKYWCYMINMKFRKLCIEWSKTKLLFDSFITLLIIVRKIKWCLKPDSNFYVGNILNHHHNWWISY